MKKIKWAMQPLRYYSIIFKTGRHWYMADAHETTWSITGGHKPRRVLIRKLSGKEYKSFSVSTMMEPAPEHPLRVIMEKYHYIVHDPLAWRITTEFGTREGFILMTVLKNGIKVLH